MEIPIKKRQIEKLTVETLCKIIDSDKKLCDGIKLNLSGRDLARVNPETLITLKYPDIRRLDLSKNQLGLRSKDKTNEKSSTVGIRGHPSLTWLNLSENGLADAAFEQIVQECGPLMQVLSASKNKITKLPENLMNLTQLNAIIVNECRLTTLDGGLFTSLPKLNTIVASHNQLLSDSLVNFDSSMMPSLTKISLSHNLLTKIPKFLATSQMNMMKELRLNDNKIKHLKGPLPSTLEILDLGNNQLSSLKEILDCLQPLPKLYNLTLRGNPVYTNEENVADKVKNFLPYLRILDGDRFDHKFVQRKKRVALKNDGPECVKKQQQYPGFTSKKVKQE